jgi:Zn-dependent protease
MFRSIRLGSAFGIPLYLHPSFFLLPLLALAWGRRGGPSGMIFEQVLLLALFGCVLLHELGHALAARAFGIRTRDITLYPIGGVARLESTGHSPWQEVCVALAGPAVNVAVVALLAPLAFFALAAGLLDLADPLAGPLTALGTFVTSLAVVNAGLVAFNLLPVFPMDGGRVLRAVLAMTMSHLRATEIAATLGLFAAGGMALVGLLWDPALVLVAAFVAFAGQQELAALRQRAAARASEPEPAGEATHPGLNGFTGFLYDRDHHVWVPWVNGRPAHGR